MGHNRVVAGFANHGSIPMLLTSTGGMRQMRLFGNYCFDTF